jgi:hypothetical protein
MHQRDSKRRNPLSTLQQVRIDLEKEPIRTETSFEEPISPSMSRRGPAY